MPAAEGFARAAADAIRFDGDALWRNSSIRWLSSLAFEVTLDIDGPSFVVSVSPGSDARAAHQAIWTSYFV